MPGACAGWWRARDGAQLHPRPAAERDHDARGLRGRFRGWPRSDPQDRVERTPTPEDPAQRPPTPCRTPPASNGYDETALMLQLERSYTASAKILTMVDACCKTS